MRASNMRQFIDNAIMGIYFTQMLLTYAHLGFGGSFPIFTGWWGQKWQFWTEILTRFSINSLLFRSEKEYQKSKK